MESDRDTLLSMVGIVILEEGYWYEINAKVVEKSEARPYGLKYELTLHHPTGKCLYRIDNAHKVVVGTGPGRRKKLEYDHQHPDGTKKVIYYDYETAVDLLKDFFESIDKILLSEGVRI